MLCEQQNARSIASCISRAALHSARDLFIEQEVGWGWLACFNPKYCLQTDKQRIIWAYKILFLDVLFPLNLRKVIFVDSDQIIRADFAELWNMDLQVHPPPPPPPLPHLLLLDLL